MTQTEILMATIPYGHDRAISRRTLALAMGVSDRMTRRLIQQARADGALILNDQDGKGYYQVDESDKDALLRQYRQDTARAISILRRRKREREILKEMGAL